MKIAIIDYEGGNLASVARAVEHLGYSPVVTSSPKEILSADKVIFPGVGAAGATMESLKKSSLLDVLKHELREKEIPCVGICIGIQILFESSEEGDIETLGIFPGKVKRFPSDAGIRIPHIGWNKVLFSDPKHPYFKGLKDGDFFYFVNSYHIEPEDKSMVLGKTQYGPVEFASMIQKDNWTATQFHLEKSGEVGLKLLGNILSS